MTQLVRVERLSHAAAQALQAQRDKLSFDVRQYKSFEKGTIVKVRSVSCYDVLVPGRAYPYEGVLTANPCRFREGQTVLLGFLRRNPGVPVILGQQRPTPRFLVERDSSRWTRPWPRLAARTMGRYFPAVPEGTRITGEIPNPADERYFARIVRVWTDGAFTLANAFFVWQQGIGEFDEGEPGSNVVALWESSGARLVIVEGAPIVVPGYQDGWNDGWADGINGQEGREGPYDAGRRSCEFGYGYDPMFGYDEPTVPPGNNEEYSMGYRDGYLSGWTETWNDGYRAGGCEPE